MNSKLTRKVFDQKVKELEIQFKNNVEVIENDNRALVTVKTKEMILETHKEAKYFHGAIMLCDNYSIRIENNELVIEFGFEIM